MMPFYSIHCIFTIVFALFFYRAGAFDNSPGWLWAILSAAISLLIWQWLHGGLIALVLGQVGLFFGITLFRVLRKS